MRPPATADASRRETSTDGLRRPERERPDMHGIRLLRAGKHPVYGLPFSGSVHNRLKEEWHAKLLRRRYQVLRKAFQRDLGILLSGQSRLCLERVPKGARKVLWLFNWTTLGDSVMDLAARDSIPPHVRLDLCIAPALAGLYFGEPRFGAVFSRIEDCDADYDFVLIHELSTRSLADMRRRLDGPPFASVLNYMIGEHFDRAAFVDARIRHLFELPPAPRPVPKLCFDPPPVPSQSVFKVAVALGARDPRRSFAGWDAVLVALLATWPAERRPLRFVLLGTADAGHDLEGLCAEVRRHCDARIGQTSIVEAAAAIRECAAFIGTDGGLMHLAAAMDIPGVGLFTQVDPTMRLAAGSSIVAVMGEPSMADIPAGMVTSAFHRAIAD